MALRFLKFMAKSFSFTARQLPNQTPLMVDEANDLQLWRSGGPDYTYAMVVQANRPLAEVINNDKLQYLVFGFESMLYVPKARVTYAYVAPSFYKKYRGRLSELLDAVLPLMMPFMAPQLGCRFPEECEPLPARMRACLLEKGSYWSFKDDSP